MNVVVALFRGAFQSPGSGEGGPWMWSWEYHMGLFSIILMGLFWIAVIVAILFLIRWLIVSSGHKNRRDRSGDTALEVLRMRYARGEINKEEFQEKRKDLLQR
jgi:putative membrane protein